MLNSLKSLSPAEQLMLSRHEMAALAREAKLLLRRRQYHTWGGLRLFVEDFWPVIEKDPFVGGKHIDAICLHLEACSFGLIQDLVINIPPGHMKSLLVGVFWPAWEWTRRPQARFISASNTSTLSIRDSRKMRNLVRSELYQEMFPMDVTDLAPFDENPDQKLEPMITISPDQDQKQRFENRQGGHRISLSTTTGTGEGCNHIIVDDPHNALDLAIGDADREAVLTWWKETASQRQRPPGSGARIIVMQRLHEEDLAGYLLNQQGGWVHLCLPAEFEPEDRCRTIAFDHLGGEIWEDWRENEGDLLWPEMFDAAKMEKTKSDLASSFAIAGQLQQRPSPRGGGIIQKAWWKPYNTNTDTGGVSEFPRFTLIIASVDTAYEEKEINDPSAATVWGVWEDEYGRTRVMLVFSWEEHVQFNALLNKVAWIGERFNCNTMLIEKKASGASIIQEMRRLKLGADGMSIVEVIPQGDKVARLTAQSGFVERGYVYAPAKVMTNGQVVYRNWALKVIDRCAKFPAVKHKDIVDTVSQALMWFRQSGIRFDDELDPGRDRPQVVAQMGAIY